MFALNEIQNDEETCNEYLKSISAKKPFSEIIERAHSVCPELKNFCDENSDFFKGLGKRDKGSVGKMAEFFLFGQPLGAVSY